MHLDNGEWSCGRCGGGGEGMSVEDSVCRVAIATHHPSPSAKQLRMMRWDS